MIFNNLSVVHVVYKIQQLSTTTMIIIMKVTKEKQHKNRKKQESTLKEGINFIKKHKKFQQ